MKKDNKNMVWDWYLEGGKVYRSSGTAVTFNIQLLAKDGVKTLHVYSGRAERDEAVQKLLDEGKSLGYPEEVV